MMPVRLSVRLSVTEVHWRIIANLGFKFRSHFTAHCGRRAGGRRAAQSLLGSVSDLPADNFSTYSTFSVAGPSAWNSLPEYLRDPAVGRNSFRQQLKTFLF